MLREHFLIAMDFYSILVNKFEKMAKIISQNLFKYDELV